jgi:hypothetical protein
VSIDITELPEYGGAIAAYRADKRAATEADDQLALSQAEQRWAQKRVELMEVAAARSDLQRRREAAIAQAEKDFARAPKEMYASLQDPEQILTVAKQVHAQIEQSIAAAAPQPAGTGQSWGGTPPTGSGRTDPKTTDQRLRELAPEVLRGLPGRAANDEFRRALFARDVAPRFTSVQQGAQAQQQ